LGFDLFLSQFVGYTPPILLKRSLFHPPQPWLLPLCPTFPLPRVFSVLLMEDVSQSSFFRARLSLSFLFSLFLLTLWTPFLTKLGPLFFFSFLTSFSLDSIPFTQFLVLSYKSFRFLLADTMLNSVLSSFLPDPYEVRFFLLFYFCFSDLPFYRPFSPPLTPPPQGIPKVVLPPFKTEQCAIPRIPTVLSFFAYFFFALPVEALFDFPTLVIGWRPFYFCFFLFGTDPSFQRGVRAGVFSFAPQHPGSYVEVPLFPTLSRPAFLLQT